MLSGWEYRVTSVLGTAAITVAAVLLANLSVSQAILTGYIPLFRRLSADPLDGAALRIAILVTLCLVLASLLPLFKPQPRRFLDTVTTALQRVLIAILGLAALGYFNFSYRIPRPTLTIMGGLLMLALPVWFVWIRQPTGTGRRAVIVGDDPNQIERLARLNTPNFIGLLSPTDLFTEPDTLAVTPEDSHVITDGGYLQPIRRIAGLPRLEEVLIHYDIDLAVFAFRRADREKFFAALDTCYRRGVRVKVHRDFADSVLVSGQGSGELVDVELRPWDIQEHVFKRLFDVIFSAVGLIAALPVIVVISTAILLDDGRPLLYKQERTAGFGGSFSVYKFRTMTSEGDSATPRPDAGNDRITRVGAILRRTHLDEIPQLWAILVGTMSVVGPRAVWTVEERLLERQTEDWRKRWFVKPGLTGLAQINGVTSEDPEQKLRYDLEYIRRRTFWFDLKIVAIQFWEAYRDAVEVLWGADA